MKQAIEIISAWAVPFLLVVIPLVGVIKRVKVYEEFIDGAKEGFDVAVKIIPYLVAILVAIGMFRGSGAMDILTEALRAPLALVGFPPEVFPLAVMRSLTGSGSLGLATDIVKTHGPDSLLGRIAGTMYGSSETTFYVLAVYFGSVGIRKTRHAVPAALIADIVAVAASVAVCLRLFT